MYFSDAGKDLTGLITQKREIEDLNEKMVYIRALPTETVRGLLFHFDNSGYYIIWPENDYYKLRRWTSESNSSKYYCPSGHTKPLFVIPSKIKTRNLLVVEGEINALSLSTISEAGNFDIVSPGGVGNFTDPSMIKQLNNFLYYDTIIICVDSDVAGLNGGLKLKSLLYKAAIDAEVIINLMEKDFNQLLVEYGKNFKEAVKNEFQNLGMPEWVQNG